MASPAAAAGAVRRSKGFARFAVAVQYHGGSFLGFTHQGKAEDSLVSHRKKNGRTGTTDLRGYRSVEGRLREALDDLFGKQRWENIQASSRTDRGVHALRNTFHVDIRMPDGDRDEPKNADRDGGGNETPETADRGRDHERIERKLTDGLNFHLSRQSHGLDRGGNHPKGKQNPMMNELRVLGASKAPEFMGNPYALTDAGRARNQPVRIDWNARFSATQRTYVYRLLCHRPRRPPRRPILSADGTSGGDGGSGEDHHHPSAGDPGVAAGIPFEWDRAWCLPVDPSKDLDVAAMREAADFLVGTHDFTSFRGRLCQRSSPIVTLESADVRDDPWSGSPFGSGGGPAAGRPSPRLVTLTFAADSFLYRQVRNMVGCLVEVGKRGGRLAPEDVRDLLAIHDGANAANRPSDGVDRRWGEKFRHRPYPTAPPQGLFLVDVRHGGFRF
mmetsp:Transcript_27929/g.65664  ORF Transcript_27929/g.65664 Transcript_27929/m.65664 type:complete len:444 (+) Transcript_27929:175-1506(+)